MILENELNILTLSTLYMPIIQLANIKVATTAAAARAMDCFTFRNHKPISSGEGLCYMCLDAPYLKGAGPELPGKFKDKLGITTNSVNNNADNVKEENVARTEIDQKEPVPDQLKLETTISKDSSEEKEHPLPLKISPRQELHQYFTKVLNPNQLSQLKNYFVIWEHRFTKIIRYTCVFTSPISLETFPCGHIPEKSDGAIFHESCYWYRESSVNFLLFYF